MRICQQTLLPLNSPCPAYRAKLLNPLSQVLLDIALQPAHPTWAEWDGGWKVAPADQSPERGFRETCPSGDVPAREDSRGCCCFAHAQKIPVGGPELSRRSIWPHRAWKPLVQSALSTRRHVHGSFTASSETRMEPARRPRLAIARTASGHATSRPPWSLVFRTTPMSPLPRCRGRAGGLCVHPWLLNRLRGRPDPSDGSTLREVEELADSLPL
jgi:hypothetical protein